MNIINSAPHMQGFSSQQSTIIDIADPYPSFWPKLGIIGGFLVLLVIIDAILKIVSLWKSARSNQLVWFIALALLNTLGILPILYLVFFAKEPVFKTQQKSTKKTAKHKKG